MEYFMYICPLCKKIYKVQGTGKIVKCNNCKDKLIDMSITMESWGALSKEDKEKHISKVLKSEEEQNSNHENENEHSNIALQEAPAKKAPMYIYCCYNCKSLIKYEKKHGEYKCTKCGESLVSLEIEDSNWRELDKNSKSELINKSLKKPKEEAETKNIIEPDTKKDIDQVNTEGRGFSFFGNDSNTITDTLGTDRKHIVLEKHITCPECGKQVNEEIEVCPNCGFPIHKNIESSNLSPSSLTENNSSHSNSMRTKIIIGIVIAIAIFAVLAITIVLVFKSRNSVSSITIGKQITEGFFSEYDEEDDILLNPGEVFEVEAKVEPSSVGTENLKWSSTDESVASVNNGTITAKNNGTCSIIVEAPNGKNRTLKITVADIIGNWQYDGSSSKLDGDYSKDMLTAAHLDIERYDVRFELLYDESVKWSGTWEYKGESKGMSEYYVKSNDTKSMYIYVNGNYLYVSIAGTVNNRYVRK